MQHAYILTELPFCIPPLVVGYVLTHPPLVVGWTEVFGSGNLDLDAAQLRGLKRLLTLQFFLFFSVQARLQGTDGLVHASSSSSSGLQLHFRRTPGPTPDGRVATADAPATAAAAAAAAISRRRRRDPGQTPSTSSSSSALLLLPGVPHLRETTAGAAGAAGAPEEEGDHRGGPQH